MCIKAPRQTHTYAQAHRYTKTDTNHSYAHINIHIYTYTIIHQPTPTVRSFTKCPSRQTGEEAGLSLANVLQPIIYLANNLFFTCLYVRVEAREACCPVGQVGPPGAGTGTGGGNLDHTWPAFSTFMYKNASILI